MVAPPSPLEEPRLPGGGKDTSPAEPDTIILCTPAVPTDRRQRQQPRTRSLKSYMTKRVSLTGLGAFYRRSVNPAFPDRRYCLRNGGWRQRDVTKVVPCCSRCGHQLLRRYRADWQDAFKQKPCSWIVEYDIKVRMNSHQWAVLEKTARKEMAAMPLSQTHAGTQPPVTGRE